MIEHVEEILNLFAELTGFSFDTSPNRNGYYNQRRMERLARAQQIEPTNALFLMLLDEQLDLWLKGQTFNALDLMDPSNPNARQYALIAARGARIRDLLAGSGMPEVREQLQADMMRALHHYDSADRPEAREMAESRFAIANLWFSALDSMDRTLDTFQFLQGETETTTPRYVEHVLGFWSVNDAIRLAMTMPSGVAMCLIRQPEGIHSYFAFLIRNGGSVSIITDKTKWPHPLAHRMARRPDRHLDERMARSWFPYELLDIQYLTDEDGDVVGLNVPRQEGIIPIQQRAFKLKPIKALGGQEIVWTAFMFSLITQKFFRDNWRAPELAYTAEMIELPRIAEAAAYHANLPVPEGVYQPLVAQRLRSVDLTTDKVVADAGVDKPIRVNEWMEQRYAHRVPDEILNLLAPPSTNEVFLLRGGTVASQDPSRNHFEKGRYRGEGEVVGRVHHYDATDFGSAKQVLGNRVWIARFNQAQAIAALAADEFEARKDEILRWWKAAIDANLEHLLVASTSDTFISNSNVLIDTDDFRHKQRGDLNLLTKYDFARLKFSARRGRAFDTPWKSYLDHGHVRYGEAMTRRNVHGTVYTTGDFRCYITNRPASILVQFIPTAPEDLAIMTGVAIQRFPDVLQHWTRKNIYRGNNMLDRLDPLDNHPNPWTQIQFGVSIFLSKFAFTHAKFPKNKTVRESVA